ncbi:MAG: protease complex subunit PrcB family protein [Clostridiales bacterium]|nr:protease complex subunit PrcB family protein [Clostridiales bacterium]
MRKRFFTALLAVCVVVMVSGCGFKQLSSEKVSDLEYTVADPDEVPEELAAEIEQQINSAFTLTYMDGDYLYLARGYGEQETGGYSISVKELYLTEDSVYFETELFGPRKGEAVGQSASYPYIVVKMERREEAVVFG